MNPSATYVRQYAMGYILASFYLDSCIVAPGKSLQRKIVVELARAASSGWDLPSETYIQTSLEPDCWG
jgi:hypothetical protein